jgi:hypothetical protein
MGKRRAGSQTGSLTPDHKKVKNQPDPDVRWGSATWRWKAFKESYKIGLELVPVGDQGKKL